MVRPHYNLSIPRILISLILDREPVAFSSRFRTRNHTRTTLCGYNINLSCIYHISCSNKRTSSPSSVKL